MKIFFKAFKQNITAYTPLKSVKLRYSVNGNKESCRDISVWPT